MLTTETGLMQDPQIYKNLQDCKFSVTTQSGVEMCKRAVSVLEIGRIQSKAWNLLQCSMRVGIRRPKGQLWKAEGSALEARR